MSILMNKIRGRELGWKASVVIQEENDDSTNQGTLVLLFKAYYSLISFGKNIQLGSE